MSADSIEIIPIKTSGDLVHNIPLIEAGGKGLFTKELDQALLDRSIDVAVHSAKDIPAVIEDKLEILGYLPREDVRDAWISPFALHPKELPQRSTVGTASLRRGAMVKRLRPDLEITLLRGNVETRLSKIAQGEASATLLALAGLKRLGLEAAATSVLNIDEFLPAPGQGAIAVAAHAGDEAVFSLLQPVLHPETAITLAAERAFLRILDGSCRIPIGAHARIEAGRLALRAIVLKPDGSRFFEASLTGSVSDAARLGQAAGLELAAKIPPGFFAF